MTISDVCHIHHVSERTVRRWIAEGLLRTTVRNGIMHVSPHQAELAAEAWRARRGKRHARPGMRGT